MAKEKNKKVIQKVHPIEEKPILILMSNHI